MANILISGGGGGGVGSDEVTVTAGDVLKGKTYLGNDTDDEIGTGTLELTGDAGLNDVLSGKTFYTSDPKVKQTGTLALSGNAAPQYVYSGKTFYSTDPKNKQTGTMTVSSVVSFSTAVSGATVTLKWQNPAKGPYGGVIIRVKEGSYPTSVSDGSQAYRGTGTNSTVNGQSTATWNAIKSNITYYFRLWVYCDTSQGTLYSGSKDATAWISKVTGSRTFTSSGTFTVPYGVTSVTVFCVGGGGGGGHGSATHIYSGVSNIQTHDGSGGGGGGGGRCNRGTLSVTAGQTIIVTVGAGGGSGGTGGTTTFSSISASGGSPGAAGQSGNKNINYGGSGGSGGSGGGVGGCDHNKTQRNEYYDGTSYDAGAGGSNGGAGKRCGCVVRVEGIICIGFRSFAGKCA